MKHKLLRRIMLPVLLLGIFQRAEAGGKLYGRFPNQVNSPVFDLQLRKFTTTVEIQDQLAVVHVDEVFYNNNTATLDKKRAGKQIREPFLGGAKNSSAVEGDRTLRPAAGIDRCRGLSQRQLQHTFTLYRLFGH